MSMKKNIDDMLVGRRYDADYGSMALSFHTQHGPYPAETDYIEVNVKPHIFLGYHVIVYLDGSMILESGDVHLSNPLDVIDMIYVAVKVSNYLRQRNEQRPRQSKIEHQYEVFGA